ncbi:heterokaryon incompatibility protein-domain-containing protein [Dactylonectria estremocensis]|uniref:Heterokaryon incompatibility protein-domain-containing protein n=1 Tax=Dactylonectria estremocensis TaxID=1079267 RepID=A0A9P9ECB0_9HYPO|nr:heterokaryon incompatibility protein-domain-containing protein [Dactylonectria estremocensis]
MSAFKPLDTKVDSIRLLVLLPKAADGEICCELQHTTFTSKPHYEALSYVWSEEPADKKIKVDDEEVLVGANLYSALQTFQCSSPRPLWVDALCINLADTEERNYQASLMSYIYSRAQKVLAWLGSAPDRFTQDDLDDMKTPDRLWYMQWSDENRAAIAESLYWSRRWTIQEIFHAKKIHFHLGVGVFYIEGCANLIVGDALEHIRRRLELLHVTRERRGSDIQRLDVLLKTYSSLKCRDPLDKVFSFLGMADEAAQDLIEVDYNMGHFDLYTKLVKYHRKSTPMPNWPRCFVKDFDFGPWRHKNSYLEFSKELERSVRLVAFSHLAQKTLEGTVDKNQPSASSTARGDVFIARGAFAGKVLRLGPTYKELVSSLEPNRQWVATIEEECIKDPFLNEIRRLSEEYSREMLAWDEAHLNPVRTGNFSNSYGYRVSADDQSIDHQETDQSSESSEPRLFLATKGVMGFLPPQARAGDMIYSFWECTVGFIVRKVAEDRWMIVGRAELSAESLHRVVSEPFFHDALNYRASGEQSSKGKKSSVRGPQRKALENMLDFKLDLYALQQLTA